MDWPCSTGCVGSPLRICALNTGDNATKSVLILTLFIVEKTAFFLRVSQREMKRAGGRLAALFAVRGHLSQRP